MWRLFKPNYLELKINGSLTVFNGRQIFQTATSVLIFSRRRSCQISVTFKHPTIFLSGVTAKQAVLRLHRMENLTLNTVTKILQLRRSVKF